MPRSFGTSIPQQPGNSFTSHATSLAAGFCGSLISSSQISGAIGIRSLCPRVWLHSPLYPGVRAFGAAAAANPDVGKPSITSSPKAILGSPPCCSEEVYATWSVYGNTCKFVCGKVHISLCSRFYMNYKNLSTVGLYVYDPLSTSSTQHRRDGV